MNQQGLQKEPQRIENPMLLSIKETSEALGLTVWGIRQCIHRGDLPVVRFERGGKMFIDRRDLDKMVDRCKERMN